MSLPQYQHYPPGDYDSTDDTPEELDMLGKRMSVGAVDYLPQHEDGNP